MLCCREDFTMGCDCGQESSCEEETRLSRLANMGQLAPSYLHVRMTGIWGVACVPAPPSTLVGSWIDIQAS